MKARNVLTTLGKSGWLFLLSLCPNFVYAQSDTLKVPIDTIYFDRYKAVFNEYIDRDNFSVYNWEIFFGESKILSTFKYFPGPEFHDLCHSVPPCYFKDITGDKVGEIMLSAACGGTAAFETTVIYSLDSTATEIGLFDGLNHDLNYADLTFIDADSIPEVVSNDLNYRERYFYPGGPFVFLVWKWDPSIFHYRLANYKLGDLILKKFHKIDMDSFSLDKFLAYEPKIDRYDYGNDEDYPEPLFSYMTIFNYAGYPEVADSILNRLWPDSVTGKELFAVDAKKKMESAPYWPELQQSDW